MHAPGSSKPTGIEWAMVIIGLFVMIALFGLALSSLPGLLAVRPSLTALIPAAGILSTVILLITVNARRARMGNMFWFALFLGTLIYWGASELMLHLSGNDAMAVFWRLFTSVASSFTPVTLLLFVITQTRPKLLERKLVPWLVVFGAGITLLCFMLSTNFVYDHTVAHVQHLDYGREVAVSESGGGLIYILWVLSLMVLITILLIKHYRQQTDVLRRNQSRMFLVGTLLFLIGTITSDILLPLVFGLVDLPPVGMLLAAAMAALYSYGLLRYNLFVLNPATVAPNILATMAEAVIVTDADYRILFSNPRSEQLLGDAQHALTGVVLSTAFKPAAWDDIRTTLTGKLKGTDMVSFEDVAVVGGQRSSAFVDISVSQVRDDDDRLAGIVWVLNDISSLKEANAQLAREKASVERKVVARTLELSQAQAQLVASVRNLPFGFALINEHSEILYSNDILAKLVNHTIPAGAEASHRVLGEIAANFRPAIDLSGCLAEAQEKRQPLERNIEFGPRFYRFFFVPVLTSTAGSKEVESIGTVMLMEDTTEAKALERSRDEFFSIASHELRTPLTAVRGNASMILDYYKEELKDPELHGLISDIHSASLRLIDIVNDFLDVSRLEQGKMVFKNEPFDLAKLTAEVVREYDVTGSRRKLAITVEADSRLPLAVADQNRVRQILINLLSNGIRYTAKGGITLHVSKLAKNTLALSVTDTGMGIAVESQHLLFHKFQQAAGNILTRDNTQSTGLGLYISKLLAEGVKGRIYLAHTEVGKGSTFTLEIPAATTRP